MKYVFENKGKWLKEAQDKMAARDTMEDPDFLDGDDEVLTFEEEELDIEDNDIEEEPAQKNEVRYIDPNNLDKYDPNEIEEVTTKSGEKRYKRKSSGSTNKPVEKKEPEQTKKYNKVADVYADAQDDISKIFDAADKEGKKVSKTKTINNIRDKYAKYFDNKEDLDKLDKMMNYFKRLF